MADASHDIDFVEVRSDDILAERVRGWDQFTVGAKWAIGLTIVVLLALYIFWG